jgi:hypothetical protein
MRSKVGYLKAIAPTYRGKQKAAGSLVKFIHRIFMMKCRIKTKQRAGE